MNNRAPSQNGTYFNKFLGDEWRNKDWFKHASRAKLYHGLNCSKVVPVFAVARQFHLKKLAD